MKYATSKQSCLLKWNIDRFHFRNIAELKTFFVLADYLQAAENHFTVLGMRCKNGDSINTFTEKFIKQ